jgi:hypothetical protein
MAIWLGKQLLGQKERDTQPEDGEAVRALLDGAQSAAGRGDEERGHREQHRAGERRGTTAAGVR